MEELRDFREEQEYLVRVEQVMFAVIREAMHSVDEHTETMKMIVSDAWEDMRSRPTEISPQEIGQLDYELSRYDLRKSLLSDQANRFRKMLGSPYFARVDFKADGSDTPERITIGLYAVSDEGAVPLVYDWRAPICTLYYDSTPGPVSYSCPAGVIRGEMTLKRQYNIQDGQLKYYMDLSMSFDDAMLMDILSGSSSRYMRQIVATIQAEQNTAIRYDRAPVIGIVGGAGSGKTSVAMHRAAYLMYRQREHLDASRIQIITPGSAFSEYISCVLPEMGEENIPAMTLRNILGRIIGRKPNTLMRQTEHLLNHGEPHRVQSIQYKCCLEFLHRLNRFVEEFNSSGPDFRDLVFEDSVLIPAEDMQANYRREGRFLTPAQRLQRVGLTQKSRLKARFEPYEAEYAAANPNMDRKQVRYNVRQRTRAAYDELEEIMTVTGKELLRGALRTAPESIRTTFEENTESGLVWWEDAVAEAYLLVVLGFVPPDKTVYHLLVDETQDYSEEELALLHVYYPLAKVTLLGDPKQRTTPYMPACEPEHWGECFGVPDAPILPLSRCYRSTANITRLCNAILPTGEKLQSCGREGEEPEIAVYSPEKLKSTLAEMHEKGYQSIAVITRTFAQAEELSGKVEKVYRLEGDESDLDYKAGDNVISCYNLVKGMEFDAVVVVWPDAQLNDEERRRLYTACSRALHAVSLLAGEKLIRELGIVL